ncbi:MAG: AMP-binding protein, partial [Cyanobacteria bacterium P01_C01_bin.120]
MAATLSPTAIAQQRHGEAWLMAPEAHTFWSQFKQFQAQFATHQPHDILLAEACPVRFLAAFLAATAHPCRLWLANPQWGHQEWQQVAAQCHPDIAIGTVPPLIKAPGKTEDKVQSPHSPSHPATQPPSHPATQPPRSTILIPTGGSSGNIRFDTHTWETLSASVQGFCQHFDCPTVNAYCLLPLYHVSGLMQALRCWLTGGKLVVQTFQAWLQQGPISQIIPSDDAVGSSSSFISLVPTQLQRSLQASWDTVSWLKQFTAILLGGAPPWPSLLTVSRDLRLPLAPTYGMTETASQVATLLPREFLSGQASSGRALPHAQLKIQDATSCDLPPGVVGAIAIAAQSLALASGTARITSPLRTGDLGYLDQAGFLHVVGRETALIITGGEKVQPAEVEAAILA